VNRKIRIVKFGLKKLENISVIWYEVYFNISNRLAATHSDRQTDRRTDIPMTDAAVQYAARLKRERYDRPTCNLTV